MQRSVHRVNGSGVNATAAGTVRQALLMAGLLGSATLLMVACSSGEDLVTTAAPPSTQSYGSVHGHGAPLPADADPQSAKFNVTPAQRGFLDALTAAACIHRVSWKH